MNVINEVTSANGSVLSPARLELQIEVCDMTSDAVRGNPAICTLGVPFAPTLQTKIFNVVKVCNVREEELGRGEIF